MAHQILELHGTADVSVEPGEIDAYSPNERRIELFHERFTRRSTSAAAIAAHEAAHAHQHALAWLPFRVWLALALPSILVSLAWFPVAVSAAVLGSETLAFIAFGLFGFTTIMGVLTVWVEVDASRRALRDLRALTSDGLDEHGARRILVACGATYLVDTLLDIGFIGRRLRRDDDKGSEGSGDGRSSGDDGDGFFSGSFD